MSAATNDVASEGDQEVAHAEWKGSAGSIDDACEPTHSEEWDSKDDGGNDDFGDFGDDDNEENDDFGDFGGDFGEFGDGADPSQSNAAFGEENDWGSFNTDKNQSVPSFPGDATVQSPPVPAAPSLEQTLVEKTLALLSVSISPADEASNDVRQHYTDALLAAFPPPPTNSATHGLFPATIVPSDAFPPRLFGSDSITSPERMECGTVPLGPAARRRISIEGGGEGLFGGKHARQLCVRVLKVWC